MEKIIRIVLFIIICVLIMVGLYNVDNKKDYQKGLCELYSESHDTFMMEGYCFVRDTRINSWVRADKVESPSVNVTLVQE